MKIINRDLSNRASSLSKKDAAIWPYFGSEKCHRKPAKLCENHSKSHCIKDRGIAILKAIACAGKSSGDTIRILCS